MYLDYIQLTKGIHKDNICIDYLEHQSTSYATREEKFILKGKNIIELYLNECTSEIRLNANFPYFWQGHNFAFSKAQLVEAIQHTSEILNLNLFEAEIKTFEFGTILKTERPAEEIILNHISYNGKELQPFFRRNKLTGKQYQTDTILHKLYDAGRNIKTKLPKAIRADLSRLYGYDDANYYLKIENHYKKPERHFRSGTLFLNDAISDSFLMQCKADLLNTYKNIMKTGIVKLPEEKKNINSSTIPLIVLKELAALYNFNAEDLLLQRIKSIPESRLSKEDKKARKRQIESNLKKVQLSGLSEYDLSKQLEAQEIL